MKNIYIVLTYTGTILSKIIKTYTKDEFSHVSLALDENLDYMYSFGRKNPYNPFLGGFVHEGVNKGTFKRFNKTKAAIYSLEVDDEKYEKIKSTIQAIQKAKKPYKFNVIGLFAVAFKLKIQNKDSFYCAEFVDYVLNKSGIETNLPEIIRPDDFKRLRDLKLKYEGELREYNPRQNVKKNSKFKNDLIEGCQNLNRINEMQINRIRGIEECRE